MKFSFDIKIKKLYSVEARLEGLDIINFSVQKLTLSKGKLEKVLLGEDVSFNSLKKILKRDYPVVLTVIGKGIVSKKLVKIQDHTPEKILGQLLANADLKTFAVQYFELPNLLVASAIRSEKLEEIRSKIPRANIIVGLYLGDFVSTTMSIFRSYENEVLIHNYVVQLENEIIIDYKESQPLDEFRFSDEILPHKLIPSYAAGLNFFSGILNTISGGVEWIAFNYKEQQNKFLYNYVRLGLMGILLLTLLVNDQLSRSYSNQIEKIQVDQNDKFAKVDVANTLRGKVELKKKFVAVSGIHSQSPLAAYADNIASSVPGRIVLTEMILEPISKNFTKKNRAEFKSRLMIVRGECHSSQTVNQWLDRIKKFGWCEQAVVSNYEQNRRDNFSEFELEIITNGNLE